MPISHKAKKSLGQHFLTRPALAARIAEAAKLTRRDTVFEIGPGTGILTRELLARAGQVIALEADAALVATLRETFAGELAAGRLTLIHGDVRTFAIDTLPRGYALVANIPYYLTGEILRRFLGAARQPKAMTLLVQKEVATRIARDKKESLLSLSVKAYGDPAYAFTVSRGAFAPPPKVDSAVLTIRDISRRRFARHTKGRASDSASARAETRFFALIHAGFAHKRKRLAKNLAEAGYAAEAARVPAAVRAEDVPLAAWLALAR